MNVMRTDARRLDEFFSFDQILLDAPCTGTGTLRAGDERAEKRMTRQLLAKVVKSQRALLDRALTILKPDGTLVYSTCSILAEENDEQVHGASNVIGIAKSCPSYSRSPPRMPRTGRAPSCSTRRRTGLAPCPCFRTRTHCPER